MRGCNIRPSYEAMLTSMKKKKLCPLLLDYLENFSSESACVCPKSDSDQVA